MRKDNITLRLVIVLSIVILSLMVFNACDKADDAINADEILQEEGVLSGEDDMGFEKPEDICYDVDCFLESLKECKKVKFTAEINGKLELSTISLDKDDHDNCVVYYQIINAPEERLKSTEGMSMFCSFPKERWEDFPELMADEIVIKSMCKGNFTDIMKDVCQTQRIFKGDEIADRCYEHKAASIKDFGLCENAILPGPKASCIDHVDRLLSFDLAVENNTPEVCERWPEGKVERCYAKFGLLRKEVKFCQEPYQIGTQAGCVNDIARALLNDSACDVLDDIDMKADCMWSVLVVQGKEEFCSKLDGWERDKCYFILALDDKDIDVCDNILEQSDGDFSKDLCHVMIAEAMMSETKTEYCDDIKNLELKSRCDSYTRQYLEFRPTEIDIKS